MNWAARGMKLPFRPRAQIALPTRNAEPNPRPVVNVPDVTAPAGGNTKASPVDDGPVYHHVGPAPKGKADFRKASTTFLKWGLGKLSFSFIFSLITHCGAGAFGTGDARVLQRHNFSYKTFELTAEALKLRLYWIGGAQWGYPGTGFDVDALEGYSWNAIWQAIVTKRLYFKAWSAGMCDLHLSE